MAKRLTLGTVYESLLQLTEAVNSMSRDNERQFAGVNRRLDDHDRHFITIDRRLANLEDGQAELQAELSGKIHSLETRMIARFDRLEQRVASAER